MMKRWAIAVVLAALMGAAIWTAGVRPAQATPHLLGDCSTTWASGTITSLTATCTGVVTASGTYTVGGGATRARIQCLVDGVVRQEFYTSTATGTWLCTMNGITLGSHTFSLKVTPLTSDGTICHEDVYTVSQTFTVSACLSASLSCVAQPYPSYRCTGTASGGSAPYTAWWGYQPQGGSITWSTGGTGNGPFYRIYICKTSSLPYTVHFKAVDSVGTTSNIVTWTCGLEP